MIDDPAACSLCWRTGAPDALIDAGSPGME